MLVLGMALATALPVSLADAQQGGPQGGDHGGRAGMRGGEPDDNPSSRDRSGPGARQGSGRTLSPPGETETAVVPFPDSQPAFGGERGGQPDLNLPAISGFAAPEQAKPLARQADGEITLTARLTENGGEVSRGLVWRIFQPAEDAAGKLPLVASARGGTKTFNLDRGSYLVHASFGRAGATMRVTVGSDAKRQTLVLDAGGLKLDAVVAGHEIAGDKVRFSIYEVEEDATGERALIIPNVNANGIVRLNAGTYHVVSTYGDVNAVIRSDIRVEAGKLTEATVEHRASQLTLKLVREAGGEAMADTSWSVLTDGGDLVRESVGAYASMVLAEGSYTVVAKNRDRIYQRDVEVSAGDDKEFEVLATEATPPPSGEISD